VNKYNKIDIIQKSAQQSTRSIYVVELIFSNNS